MSSPENKTHLQPPRGLQPRLGRTKGTVSDLTVLSNEKDTRKRSLPENIGNCGDRCSNRRSPDSSSEGRGVCRVKLVAWKKKIRSDLVLTKPDFEDISNKKAYRKNITGRMDCDTDGSARRRKEENRRRDFDRRWREWKSPE